jgi:hypothetical protein
VAGPAALTWAQVRARRLERHRLAAPPAGGSAADVVAAMCGAHAQVLTAAELSVALRWPGTTRAHVREALWSERSLVKTLGPRGTVHLLPARDLPMWTGALSAIPGQPGPLAPDARLTPEQTDAVVAATADALADAELTVDELTEQIVARVGSWAGDPVMPAFQGWWPRWRQAMHIAAHRGALCFGPNRDRRVTYASPARLLPGFRPDPGPAALARLVRGYLHAYGPATPTHFARWLSAPQPWAAELFAARAATGELEPVGVDGLAAWQVAGDSAGAAGAAGGLRLLPYFDAYAVGSHPREWVFPGPAGQRALSGGQAGPFPVLLIDGVVAGVWHQRRSGRTLHITVEPLRPLGRGRRSELAEQVARTGEILEGRPELTIGPVSVGPHA